MSDASPPSPPQKKKATFLRIVCLDDVRMESKVIVRQMDSVMLSGHQGMYPPQMSFVVFK